jgi:leader peptidase (prepilin peptidase) / N-methyltransferase
VIVSTARRLRWPDWLAELVNGYATAAPNRQVLIGLAAAAAVAISLFSAPNLSGILGAALALVMLTIAVIDGRRFIIPNELNVAGLGLAIVNAVVVEPEAILTSVTWAGIRGSAFLLIFFGIRSAYKWMRGREGIGLGDVKLAGVAGCWLDWSIMPIAIEVAVGTALSVYLLRQLSFGRPIRATSRLPFGMFFAPAIWLCWLLQAVLAPF